MFVDMTTNAHLNIKECYSKESLFPFRQDALVEVH
jgi:hypothetical protein